MNQLLMFLSTIIFGSSLGEAAAKIIGINSDWPYIAYIAPVSGAAFCLYIGQMLQSIHQQNKELVYKIDRITEFTWKPKGKNEEN